MLSPSEFFDNITINITKPITGKNRSRIPAEDLPVSCNLLHITVKKGISKNKLAKSRSQSKIKDIEEENAT